MEAPMGDAPLYMSMPPTLTNALSALDSHERPILLQWATGQPSR